MLDANSPRRNHSCVVSATQSFDALYEKIRAIDPKQAGSLGEIVKLRLEVQSSLEEGAIPLKQWRALIEELALVHGKALDR